MPLDPLAKRFLAMMAAASLRHRSPASLQDRRQALAKLMEFARGEAAEIAGIDGVCRARPAMFHTVCTSPAMIAMDCCRAFCSSTAAAWSPAASTRMTALRQPRRATGCRLVSVGYRLAPEHKFPAAIEDAIAAAKWVSRNAASLGIDAGKLVVGGDSAGATLAAAVCQDAARNAGPPILLQCLICPVLDFGATSPSREAFAENYLLDRHPARGGSRRLSAWWRRSCRSQDFAAARRRSGRASRRHHPYRRVRSDARRRQCLCGKAGGGRRRGRASLSRRHDSQLPRHGCRSSARPACSDRDRRPGQARGRLKRR